MSIEPDRPDFPPAPPTSQAAISWCHQPYRIKLSMAAVGEWFGERHVWRAERVRVTMLTGDAAGAPTSPPVGDGGQEKYLIKQPPPGLVGWPRQAPPVYHPQLL